MGIYQVAPGIRYAVNDTIARILDKKRHLVTKRDRDFFFIVDGDEGSGKSFLTFQLAKFLDPTFCLNRICFTPQEFLKAVGDSNKGEAIVYDEAFTGFSARRSMSEISNMLNETVFECRKKNLFVFIVLPSMFFLDRTIVLHRGRVLIHTYFKNENRGCYCVYDKNQLKILILKGRKNMSYAVVKPKLRCKFTGRFALDKEGEKVNEEIYSNRKVTMIKSKSDIREGGVESFTDLQKRWLAQRNFLVWMVTCVWGLTRTNLLKMFDVAGIPLSKTTVKEAVQDCIKYSILLDTNKDLFIPSPKKGVRGLADTL